MARLPAGAAGALLSRRRDEERQLQLIRSQLTDWQAQLGEARFEQAISADLLQDYLGSVLGSPAPASASSPVRSTSAP